VNTSASRLHPRNPHQGRYDLKALVALCPELTPHLTVNPSGEQTVDFRNEHAVRLLNQALLMQHYQVAHWNIPEGYLCPPIPGRADYIHYAADLLAGKKKNAKVLDIGTGANCIYPIIGSRSYGWQFVGSEIDPIAVATAKLIVESNPLLKNKIKFVQQKNKQVIFKGVIGPHDLFDLTLCNPPFHASLAEANAGSERKQHNLNRHKAKRNSQSANPDTVNSEAATNARNFGGQKAELWCAGGEIGFLKQMMNESRDFSQQVMWFTSLVSKNDNVKPLKQLLNQIGAKQIKVVSMSQGQKVSRLIAWSFLTDEQLAAWNEQRLK
jgi:23S rRNA (adenine1618-N6)-methyltransferase